MRGQPIDAELARACVEDLGLDWYYRESTGSTNADVLSHFDEHRREVVAFSEAQSAGRGRRAGGDLPKQLERATHLDLVCGRGRWEGNNAEATAAFGRVLDSKGISHSVNLWGRDVTHEPHWWLRQAALYLSRRFGNEESPTA